MLRFKVLDVLIRCAVDGKRIPLVHLSKSAMVMASRTQSRARWQNASVRGMLIRLFFSFRLK